MYGSQMTVDQFIQAQIQQLEEHVLQNLNTLKEKKCIWDCDRSEFDWRVGPTRIFSIPKDELHKDPDTFRTDLEGRITQFEQEKEQIQSQKDEETPEDILIDLETAMTDPVESNKMDEVPAEVLTRLMDLRFVWNVTKNIFQLTVEPNQKPDCTFPFELVSNEEHKQHILEQLDGLEIYLAANKIFKAIPENIRTDLQLEMIDTYWIGLQHPNHEDVEPNINALTECGYYYSRKHDKFVRLNAQHEIDSRLETDVLNDDQLLDSLSALPAVQENS